MGGSIDGTPTVPQILKNVGCSSIVYSSPKPGQTRVRVDESFDQLAPAIMNSGQTKDSRENFE